MHTEAMLTLILLLALVACGLAYSAHRYAKRAYDITAAVFHIIENRSSRTIVCDLQDGRITVIKELKDAN